MPVISPPTNSRPPMANAVTVTSRSVAKAVMPPPVSRARSRRACSSGGRSSSRPPRSASGSATRRSSPVAASTTHRQLTGSVPPRLRRNTMRRPSGDTTTSRGSPSVKRWVRADWRGKESLLAHRARTVGADQPRASRMTPGGVGVDGRQHVAVRRGPLLERAAVDDGHPARERAGRLDGDVASLALEQVGVGQGEHGARVVDGGAGDGVVAGDVRLGEEREQVGERRGEEARSRGERRRSAPASPAAGG